MAFNLLADFARDPEMQICAVLMNDGKLSSALRAEGIRTYVIDETTTGNLQSLHLVSSIVRSFCPGIVHTHRQKENVLGAIAAKLAGAQSIRTVHGWTEFPDLGLRLDKHLFRWLDGACARYLQKAIVAVSCELKDKLIQEFKTDSITVIENGIDVGAVRDAARGAPDIPIDPTRHAVGIVARLVPVKRHDRFIAMAEILNAERPGFFEFHIVGDGPLQAELVHRVESGSLDQHIHIHGFRENAVSVIAAMSVVVICSDHEGIPMNALEASSLGVPLVTAPLPSMEKILATGVAGVVCGDSTPRSLADGVIRSIDAPRQPNASVDGEWLFSQRVMATRYKQLYRALLGGRSGAKT